MKYNQLNDRIDQLRANSVHIDVVSDVFKLEGCEKESSFRGIIHYLDKDGQWAFTDTGMYKDIFECIQETIMDAEHISKNWL